MPLRSPPPIEDVDAFFRQRDASHGRVKLSFSRCLNALDRVATQEGDVRFMASNHTDRLGEALIRAGRIGERVGAGVCLDARAGAGVLTRR